MNLIERIEYLRISCMRDTGKWPKHITLGWRTWLHLKIDPKFQTYHPNMGHEKPRIFGIPIRISTKRANFLMAVKDIKRPKKYKFKNQFIWEPYDYSYFKPYILDSIGEINYNESKRSPAEQQRIEKTFKRLRARVREYVRTGFFNPGSTAAKVG